VPGNAVPFINVRVFSRGLLIHTVSRIYFSDCGNKADPLFASIDPVRSPTLIAQRSETAEGTVYRWDIRMQGEGETVFFDLI
jgi:protocatechuate 3,4-dioxygenase alpha subunit